MTAASFLPERNCFKCTTQFTVQRRGICPTCATVEVSQGKNIQQVFDTYKTDYIKPSQKHCSRNCVSYTCLTVGGIALGITIGAANIGARLFTGAAAAAAFYCSGKYSQW